MTSPKKGCFVNNTTQQVKQQVTLPIQILMWTYHNGVNQEKVKSKILEFVRTGEK